MHASSLHASLDNLTNPRLWFGNTLGSASFHQGFCIVFSSISNFVFFFILNQLLLWKTKKKFVEPQKWKTKNCIQSPCLEWDTCVFVEYKDYPVVTMSAHFVAALVEHQASGHQWKSIKASFVELLTFAIHSKNI